jgi:hypothetical protein
VVSGTAVSSGEMEIGSNYVMCVKTEHGEGDEGEIVTVVSQPPPTKPSTRSAAAVSKGSPADASTTVVIPATAIPTSTATVVVTSTGPTAPKKRKAN